jgi:predicted DNA-binding transcriptional regulator AlpA
MKTVQAERERVSDEEAVRRSLERVRQVRRALEARQVVTLGFAAKIEPDGPSWDVETVMRLLRDPTQVETVVPEVIPRLLGVLRTVEVSLLAKLTKESLKVAPSQLPPQEDRLLTPQQAAELLGVSVRWLYGRSNKLPFSRRLSRKMLRFSEPGIRRYLATRTRS